MNKKMLKNVLVSTIEDELGYDILEGKEAAQDLLDELVELLLETNEDEEDTSEEEDSNEDYYPDMDDFPSEE